MSRRKDLEAKIQCKQREIDRINRRGLYSLQAQRLQDLLDMLKDELESLNDADSDNNP